MTRQFEHVGAPLPERRHRDRKHVEAVIEVFAELPVARALGQIAIGRGDDAHIDLHRTLGADGIDFAFLQRAQELHLHVETQFADFVEEQRAAVGFQEFAEMFVGGAGERTFLVTEEDRFDEIFRDGAAIDGDKGFAGTLRRTLDRACDEFFADAGFAFDQDRDIRLCRALPQADHLTHFGAFADEIVEDQPVFDFLLQARHFAGQRADLQRVADRDRDALGARRLHEEVAGAGAHGVDGGIDAALGGQHDHRQFRLVDAQLRHHRHAVHVGHDEIEQDERDLVAARTVQEIERGLAARRGHDIHAASRDRGFEKPALYGIVVDDKNRLRHRRSVVSPMFAQRR